MNYEFPKARQEKMDFFISFNNSQVSITKQSSQSWEAQIIICSCVGRKNQKLFSDYPTARLTMPKYSTSIFINADQASVWKVLSDVAHWHEWTPTVTKVEVLDQPEL